MSRDRRIRRLTALATAAGIAALALPATGAAALTATGTTIAGRPAYDQIVVAFGGGRLTGLGNQVDALDPQVADGRAVVRVKARGIATSAPPRTRSGVRVRIGRRPGNVVVVIDAPINRFKFVSYAVDGSRTRLVIRLWKATTRAAARILDDGCLRLTGWRGGRGTARVRGLELTPLFEHNVVTSLRAANAGGSEISLRPRIASGFRFLPDFSGYSRPGRFGGPLPYSIAAPRRVMLEAWSQSAKDGALECLVQTPVIIRP